jgi:glutamine amidotransferase
MGWNQLEFDTRSPLLRDINPGDHVYFVHSYSAPVGPLTLATATYGEQFSALVQSGNVFGAQFHPERSARTGSLLIRNFLQLQPTH